VYAHLAADEDLRDARAQERRQLALALRALFDEKTAWLAPAIQALGAERVRSAIAADPVLAERFDFFLEDTLRHAAHTLSPQGEALLAAAGIVLAQPNAVHQQFADLEIPRAAVTLASGRRITLTLPVYEQHRSSPVRADRKRIFDAFFGSWRKAKGTLGANLAARVQGDVFAARARRHATVLDAELFADDMPAAVYRTLVQQCHEALPVLHRYLRLRKRLLGIRGDLAYYDNYVPLVKAPKGFAARFDLERSKAVTLDALAPLGTEYRALLERGFAARWTDSHPRPGKVSGAYMNGDAHELHPYVLLNHNNDFDSLSTLAHEWGHAMHSVLANAAQPYEKAAYSTFTAETAAITNELLLADHLARTARSPAERRYVLAHSLETIRTTFFRQVLFAEFQLAITEEVEQGRPLSGARLNELYLALLRRYYGHDAGVTRVDAGYAVEWAYVSHFYMGYYVWQYATSLAGAASFADSILTEGGAARERYLALLAGGGCDHPYALYRRAGVDLADPAPYRALAQRMNRLIDEIGA
jgi:oligoendopeptidase F